jgi:hypothetical protein
VPAEHSEHLMEAVPALSRHDVAAARLYADRRPKAHRFGFARGRARATNSGLSTPQDGEKAAFRGTFCPPPAEVQLRPTVVVCSRFTRADFRTRPGVRTRTATALPKDSHSITRSSLKYGRTMGLAIASGSPDCSAFAWPLSGLRIQVQIFLRSMGLLAADRPLSFL